MGLNVTSKRRGGILLTITAVLALVAQPMYGFVNSQVARAVEVPGSEVTDESSVNTLANSATLTVALATCAMRTNLATITGDRANIRFEVSIGGEIFRIQADHPSVPVGSFDIQRAIEDFNALGTGVTIPLEYGTHTVTTKRHLGGGVDETLATGNITMANPSAVALGCVPATPTLNVTPATCQDPRNMAVYAGERTDVRMVVGEHRIEAEKIPTSSFDIVAALAANGITADYGEFNGQFVWYDRDGDKQNYPIGNFSGNLIDPATLECSPADTNPPSFAMSAPQRNQAVSGMQTIRAEIIDESGIKKVLMTLATKNGNKTYTYEAGKSNNSLVKNGDTYSVAIDTNTLPDGETFVVLRGTDGADNTRYWNNNAAIRQHSFVVDNAKPSSTNDLPAMVNGALTVTQVLTDNHKAQSGKLRIWKLDANGVQDNSKFFATSDVAVNSSGNVVYQLDTKQLHGDGKYMAKFTATDAAGNASVVNVPFTVDTTLPSNFAITLAGGNSAQGATVAGKQTFTFTQTEANPKSIYIEYMEKNSSGKWSKKLGKEVLGANTAALTVDTDTWGEGVHQVKVTTKDAAGNATSTTAQFTVDNTKPAATVKMGTGFTIGSNGTYQKVSYSLYDAYEIDKVVINGVAKDLSNNRYGDVNFITKGVFGAVEGLNTMVVYDVAGNSQSYTFTIDQQAPVATTASVDGPVKSLDGIAKLRLTLQDESTDIVSAKYTLYDDVTDEVIKKNVAISGVYNSMVVDLSADIDVSTLPTGQYRIQLHFNDSAGNQGKKTVRFVVDNSIVYTMAATSYTTSQPTISGLAVWLAGDDEPVKSKPVVVTIEGKQYMATTSEVGAWSVNITTPLDTGTYDVVFENGQQFAFTTTVSSVSTDPAPIPPSGTNSGEIPVGDSEGTPVQASSLQSTPSPAALPIVAAATPVAATPIVNSPAVVADDAAVLGTNSTDLRETSDEADVKGVSDESTGGWFASVMNYWWLLIVAAAAGLTWWFIAARRRRAQQEI